MHMNWKLELGTEQDLNPGTPIRDMGFQATS